MNASYVSANTFTVGSDRTSEFVPGRRIKADCGVDGYKYGTVESSSYSSVTTVVLIESVLTSNLTTVLYGIVSSGSTGSLPVHAHDDSAGEGGTISGTGGGTSDVETLLDLTDTPAVYDSGKYLRSTASGTEWATVSGIATGALLEDGSVPLTGDWNYGPYTISGTGDIYCNDLHTSGSTIYLGSVQLSADGINLAVNTETISSLSHGAGVPEAAPSVSKYYIDTDSGGFYYHAAGAISTVLYEGSDTNKSQISASSIYTGTYPASNAFDGETNSNVWISDDSNGPNPDGSCWLQWDFGTQKRIREFRMRRRPNAGSENFPNEMEIYVSATGDFTGEETFVGSASNNDAAFNTWAGWNTISAPKAARYLRIEIHSMHRSGSGYDWVTVSEVQFMEDENLETGWNSVYESASNFTDLDDTPATYSGITTGSGIANKYLKATASGIEFEDFKVESVGSNWDDDHFVMGTYHLWIDSSGRLRVKNGAPTSDTDGTIVGTQS